MIVPLGITYIPTIDEVWVIDADGNIYRYNTSGVSLGELFIRHREMITLKASRIFQR